MIANDSTCSTNGAKANARTLWLGSHEWYCGQKRFQRVRKLKSYLLGWANMS